MQDFDPNEATTPTAQPRERLTLGDNARLTLRDHVRRQLRLAIISGKFRFGERLNERKLAEELDISTTPLKEALRQLETEGLIEVLPRRGIVVRFDVRFAEEMILARAALEAPLAAMAAHRIDEAGREALCATVEGMKQATEAADISRLVDLNDTFHQSIHIAARSVHLTRLVEKQQFYDDSVRRVVHRNSAESQAALVEHSNICTEIVGGNPSAAKTCMHDHVMRSGRLYLLDVFGSTLEAPL